MPPENENLNDQNVQNTAANENESDANEQLQAKIQESLKPIKEKLDSAYKTRDEALRKLAEMEQKTKEEQLKRLEAEGKEKEALELRLAEEKSRREAAEKRNTELSRDVKVRSLLSNLEFRNPRAVELAYKEIVGTLVQDENGNWKHSSGGTIEAFVESFIKDPDNAFLFKAKANTGNGTDNSTTTVEKTKPKSLFSLSQDEIIKLAQEGKLRR